MRVVVRTQLGIGGRCCDGGHAGRAVLSSQVRVQILPQTCSDACDLTRLALQCTPFPPPVFSARRLANAQLSYRSKS